MTVPSCAPSVLRKVKFKASIPLFESLAAVFLELLGRCEKVFAGLRDGLVVFTEIVGVFPAYPGTCFVDTADSPREKVHAVGIYVQEPAIRVFEDINILVRHLPDQMVEVFASLGRGNGLVYGITANRLLASGAFLVD